MITPGLRLPDTWVIHTVGPVWQGGTANEAALLAVCYRACLAYVASHSITSIAFPSISTGRYRFPIDHASQIAVQACQQVGAECPQLQEIRFVCFDEPTWLAYRVVMGEG